METLRAYLNSLDVDAQRAYAARCGTTIGYLRKACSTRPRMDGALVVALSRESHGAVTRADLRPDIFRDLEDRDVA